MHRIEVVTRRGCGSCVRVLAQVRGIAESFAANVVEVPIESDPDVAADYGDRVPVVVVDGVEFAAWEIDEEELVDVLASPDPYIGGW